MAEQRSITPKSNRAPPKTHLASGSAVRSKAPRLRKAKGYHHGNLRESLIECGLYLLDTKGREAMSLRSAARMAGVSQTAPKNHFSDKEGLLAAIAARGFRMLTEHRVEDPGSRTKTPQARLRGMILAYVSFAVARPALFDLMFGPVIKDKRKYPELDAAAERAYDSLRGVVADFLLQSGATGTSIEKLSLSVWSAMHGLATLLTNNPRVRRFAGNKDDRQLSEDLADFIVKALLN
jgi:AcrR family transcriptional regulator